MATVAQIQTQLGDSLRNARIVKTVNLRTSTTDEHYVVGGCDAPGRSRWCTTTRANTAAQQAAAILVVLRA